MPKPHLHPHPAFDQVRVQARKTGVGWSPWSQELNATTLTDVPGVMRKASVSVSGGMVTIAWNQPKSFGGWSELKSYTVTVYLYADYKEAPRCVTPVYELTRKVP